MQQSDSRAASIVARAFALQAGVAIWLGLFRFYLGIDEHMPGITGQKSFDVARYVISSIVAGLLVESIVIGRYSVSNYNLKVWYTSLLFLLPYFHYFLPRNPIFMCCGLFCMLYAGLMSEVRLWMVDSSLVGRLFYMALGLPTIFVAMEVIFFIFIPNNEFFWWFWRLELPLIYTSCILTALGFTVLSLTNRQVRPAFLSSLVVLNAVVWYFGIVKPY